MAKVRIIAGERVQFKCPGCLHYHDLYITPKEGRPAWQFNGDANSPTLAPSILMRSGHYVPNQKPEDPCWCTYEKRLGEPAPFSCGVCHSFVRNGMIEFLGDCTHALAGKTVPLEDIGE